MLMMLANIPVRFYRVFGLFFKKDILPVDKSGHDSGIVTGKVGGHRERKFWDNASLTKVNQPWTTSPGGSVPHSTPPAGSFPRYGSLPHKFHAAKLYLVAKVISN